GPAARVRRGATHRPVRMLRVLVLGGVVMVLAVLLAPALRSYLAQQQQVAALEGQIRDQQRRVVELEQEQRAWDDPAFIRAQARERLRFVMPGERSFIVLDPRVPDTRPVSPSDRAVRVASADRSWFDDIRRSAQIAGGTAAR
ncbi:MAG: septum formation initiator family protein, partial [Angustibacter sp.]